METRRTAAVDEAPYRRGHAHTAFGTVTDIYIYIYIYIEDALRASTAAPRS